MSLYLRAKHFAARFFKAVFLRGSDTPPPVVVHDGVEIVYAWPRRSTLSGLRDLVVEAQVKLLELDADARVLTLVATAPAEVLVTAPVAVVVGLVRNVLNPAGRTQVLPSGSGRVVLSPQPRTLELGPTRVLILR